MTGNAAIRASVLRSLGGFDKGFTSAFRGIAPGWEDTEISLRLLRAGYKILYRPEATTDHSQKEGLSGLLRERFNFGVNRVLWLRLQGKSLSSFRRLWITLRLLLAFALWPRDWRRFHTAGVMLTDSLWFAFIERAAAASYELGTLFRILSRYR